MYLPMYLFLLLQLTLRPLQNDRGYLWLDQRDRGQLVSQHENILSSRVYL